MGFLLYNSGIGSSPAPTPYGCLVKESGSSTYDIFFVGKPQLSGSTFLDIPIVSSSANYVKGANVLLGTNYDFRFFNPNLFDSTVRLTPVSNNDNNPFRDGEIGIINEGTFGELLNVSTVNPSFGLRFAWNNFAANNTTITTQVVGINPQSNFTNVDGDVIGATEQFFTELQYQTLAGVPTGLVIPNRKKWKTPQGVEDVTAYLPYIAKSSIAAGTTATPAITNASIDADDLTVTGTSVAGATITVYGGSTQIGTATANGSGVFSVTIAAQAVGTSITAKAIKSPDTISAASAAKVVVALPVAGQTATPVITNTSIDADDLTVTGTSVAGATITVYGGSTQIGTATANGSGVFSVTIAAQAVGTSITAKAIKSPDTISAASAAKVVVALPVAGQTATPVITNTSIDADDLTVTGTSVAGATITVYGGLTQIGTATANGSGIFSVTITPQPLNTAITAKAIKSPDIISVASSIVLVTAIAQTIATTAPVILTKEFFAQKTKNLTGTATVGAIVTIYRNGVVIEGYSASVDVAGKWSIDIPFQLVGSILTARAKEGSKDLSGNSGALYVTENPIQKQEVQPTPISTPTKSIKKMLGLAVVGIFLLTAIVGLAQGKIMRGVLLLFGALMAGFAVMADYNPTKAKELLTLRKKA